MEERSTEGVDSCSIDGCCGSLGGFTGGGGAGVVSNIMVEYFLDLKGRRF